MPPHLDHEALKALILENQRILMENNQYLRKLHSHMVWGFWIRIIGWAFILGLPVIAYYYVLAPYMSAFTTSLPSMEGSLQEFQEFQSWYDTWKQSQ
jgi:uncharacterized membrane protein (DUF106 family)